MALQLTAAPAAEPISLAEAKAHLRVDADDENALITALIAAARLLIERTFGLALITQTWSYFLDHWPRSCCITLPIAPVQAVSAVTVHDVDGGVTVLDADSYAVDVLSAPARLVLPTGAFSPELLTTEPPDPDAQEGAIRMSADEFAAALVDANPGWTGSPPAAGDDGTLDFELTGFGRSASVHVEPAAVTTGAEIVSFAIEYS